MEHTNANEVFNKKGKKATGITAILVAASLVATGIVTSALFEGNTVAAEPETAMETTNENPEVGLMILTEDFDINDAAAVTARAEAIYNISEKEYDVIDIANMIYILGEKYDAITYPESAKSDKEKFEYLQHLALLLGTMLDDGLYKYTDALVNEEIILGEQTSVPCAYMFMATSTEGKKQAIELAKIYYEQRDNVKNNDDAAMRTTAGKYYDLYKSLEEMNLSASDIVALYKNFSAINPLFTPYLTLEQAAELDDPLGKCAASTNIILQSAPQKLDISEILEDGNYCKDTTPLGESYNAGDAAIAGSHPAAGNGTSSDKTVVEEGGKPVSGSTGKQEVISTPTTSVVTEQFVAPVPETNSSNTTTKVVEQGGEIVSEEEFIVDIGSYEGTTTVIVEQGGEIFDEKYVDADAELAETLSTTYTLG